MNAGSSGPLFGRWLLRSAGVGVAVLFGLVLFAVTQARRGTALMAESDARFHRGELRGALHNARDAGLLFVPGSGHTKEAEARLIAIAKGAEAEGDLELARLAWDALRLIDEATSYPGRGETEAGELARNSLRRLTRR